MGCLDAMRVHEVTKLKDAGYWLVVTEIRLLWLIPVRSRWVGRIDENGVYWYEMARDRVVKSPILRAYLTRAVIRENADPSNKRWD